MSFNKISLIEIKIRFVSNDYTQLNLASIYFKNLFLKTKIDLDSTFLLTASQTPLPIKIRKWCVLKSPHVNKKAREHFLSTKYTRLHKIFIIKPTLFNIKDLETNFENFFPTGVHIQCFFNSVLKNKY